MHNAHYVYSSVCTCIDGLFTHSAVLLSKLPIGFP
jgi:hypothetical protein